MRHKLNVCIQCSIFAAHCSLSLSVCVCLSVSWLCFCVAFGKFKWIAFHSLGDLSLKLMFDCLWTCCQAFIYVRFTWIRWCSVAFSFTTLLSSNLFLRFNLFLSPISLGDNTHTHTRSHKFISEYNFRSKSFFFSFNFGKHHLMTQLPAECYNGYKITCGEVNRQWRA